MVEQCFVEVIKDLESFVYEVVDLSQLVQEMGLKVQISQLFGCLGGDGIVVNCQIVQIVFSFEVLEEVVNSGVIELDLDIVVVLWVKEYNKLKE